MFEHMLRRMCECICQRRYVMTLHAEEEMDADGFTILDVEHGILTGEVMQRQADAVSAEWKYCIRGWTVEDGEIEVVAKLGPTGKLVIIMVHAP